MVHQISHRNSLSSILWAREAYRRVDLRYTKLYHRNSRISLVSSNLSSNSSHDPVCKDSPAAIT